MSLEAIRDGVRADALKAVAFALPGFKTGAAQALPRDPAVWVPRLANTTFAFAPRGVGATSFRLFEALQLGVPPVLVYDKVPWLPFRHPATAVGVGGSHNASAAAAAAAAAALPPPPPPCRAGAPAPCFAWERVAHVVEARAVTRWVEEALPRLLAPAGRAPWAAQRAELRRVREDYFTYAGVLRHVWRWLEDPWRAELYCSPAVPPEYAWYA